MWLVRIENRSIGQLSLPKVLRISFKTDQRYIFNHLRESGGFSGQLALLEDQLGSTNQHTILVLGTILLFRPVGSLSVRIMANPTISRPVTHLR